MNVSVRETRIGRGIVADKDYAQDDVFFEVTGPFVSGDEDDEMDEITRSNTFRFDEDRYISPAGTIGDYQNHSCEPNAKVVKKDERLYVVAATSIQTGDEVLIDYSTIIAADDVWEMECLCGTASCRGRIGSFDTLPPSLRKKYKESEIVPRFIVELSE